MARLCAFVLLVDATAFVTAVTFYLLHGTPVAGVICASASVLTALVGAGAVALLKRTTTGGPPCVK